MTSDAELIEQRRRIDDRAFLAKAINPNHAPLLAPSLLAVLEVIRRGGWHSNEKVVAAGLRAGPIVVRTLDNVLRRAWRAGLIERRGEYTRAKRGQQARDTREWRFIEWPEEEA